MQPAVERLQDPAWPNYQASLVPPLPPGPWKSRPWKEIVARAQAGTFRLRCPAANPRGLLGPFMGHGGCLEPVFPEDRTMRFFDPTIAAADGDFVFVELAEDVLADIVQANRHRPGWLEKYSENPARLATKWLRHWLGDLYICEREHGIPLGNNRVLGVCTYLLIDGQPAYGSGPDDDGWSHVAPIGNAPAIDIGQASGQVDTSRIGDEAVTTITSFEDDSNSLTGPGIIELLTLTPLGLDYTAVVTASFNAWISASPGGGENDFELVLRGNSTVLGRSQPARISATAAPGERVTLQMEVAVEASDEGPNYNTSLDWSRDNGSTTGEIRNLNYRVEAVKK